MRNFFSTYGELIPWLDEVRRPGCQLRVGRDDTEPLLVGEDFVTDRVVPLVEEVHVADLLDPLRRRMMWRMRRARRVVNEEWQRRIEVVELRHPVDGVVRHGGNQVPSGVAEEGADRRGV